MIVATDSDGFLRIKMDTIGHQSHRPLWALSELSCPQRVSKRKAIDMFKPQTTQQNLLRCISCLCLLFAENASQTPTLYTWWYAFRNKL